MAHGPDPSEIFRILGAQKRLAIIRLLRHHGPLGAMKIAEMLGITTAAVSQHLKALRIVGLVDGERQGYHIPYSLNEDTLYDCCSEMNRACGICNHGIHEPPEDDLEDLLHYKARLEKSLKFVEERIEKLKEGE